MPELFHPELPGRGRELPIGNKHAGWLLWDELTEEQQEAEQAASAAAAEAEAETEPPPTTTNEE